MFRGLVSRLLATALIAAGALGVDGSHAQSRTDVLNPRALPLGDGKVSSEPRRGYVYSCQTQFRGGGAQHDGDWIHGSTWDATRKIWVQGDVAWPNAAFTITTSSDERRITGNGLPVNHTTGTFPVQRSDPAFQIDRNPNSIQAQQLGFSLPLMPAAGSPTCVPMGMIGVALSGVAIFNALDAAGHDAVAHEVQDHCNGHPEMRSQYHYHGPSSCLKEATASNALVGYALDGFGIYSMYDERGRELTNADLDECHGRVSKVMWDGREVNMYHYVLTREYPYTVGCFQGKPVRTRFSGPQGGELPQDGGPRGEGGPRPDGGPRQDSGPPPGGGGGGPGRMRQPPQEALVACSGRSSGAQCSFISPRGDMIDGTCRSPGDALACVPERR